MPATAPPPRPPAPPAPPRAGSHLIAIVLLVLALIVTVSLVAGWAGLRFLSGSVQIQVEEVAGGKKEFSLRTPVGSFWLGSFEVDKRKVDETSLGLPLYPGAREVRDNSASLHFGLPDQQDVRVIVGKFETPDPLEKVKGFYQERIGSLATKVTEKGSQGKTVFEIKHRDQEKVVALENLPSGTRIELVRVIHGRGESK